MKDQKWSNDLVSMHTVLKPSLFEVRHSFFPVPMELLLGKQNLLNKLYVDLYLFGRFPYTQILPPPNTIHNMPRNMPEIGISSNCLLYLPLADALEKLSAHTNFVEILSSGNHSLFDYGEVAASYSFRCSVHSPVSDGNIAEPNEKIRRASVEVLAETAEAADKINADVLVVHPGYCMDPLLFSASEAALLRSIEELGKLQNEYTVRFAVENMGSLPCLHFRTPDFLPVVREAGLGFCLDTGHALLNGVLDQFCKEQACHLHLHDNDGVQDLHGACGTGRTDFEKVLGCGAKSAVIECMTWENTERSLQYFGME